jgi:protein tyrosine/serine phosphatase
MPLNMKTVIPGRLYRSGRIAPSELAMLAAPPFNIHTIVSLDQATGMAIAPYIKSYGIRQIMVPIFASGSNVRTAATTLAQNLANITSDNGGVLIHCARGMDRTGFAIALYRVKIQ